MGIAFEVISLFLVARYLSETSGSRRTHDRAAWADLWSMLKRSVVPPPGLFGFFLCLAGDSFVWGISLGTLFGMFSKTYGSERCSVGSDDERDVGLDGRLATAHWPAG